MKVEIEFFQSRVAVNGMELNLLSAGADHPDVFLFLHGFPAYSGAWCGVMASLADAYHCIAPDLRGFNLSSKPARAEDYTADKGSADIVALIEHVSDGRAVTLVGHDIGGYVAYHVAAARPDLLSSIVVINGVHPGVFQRALSDDPAQREASRYLEILCRQDAEAALRADGFAGMVRSYEMMLARRRLDPDTRNALIASWSQPGAMAGMLNWYRANWSHGGSGGAAPASAAPPPGRVTLPHLVIWGEQDPFLMPVCYQNLADWCDDFTLHLLPDAGHAPHITHTPEVAGAIAGFAKAHRL